MYKIEESTVEQAKEILQELINSNISKVPIMETYAELNYHMKDEKGEIIAGILSHMIANWVEVNILWVDENYREKGLGSMLLSKVEEMAKEKSCKYIQVGTFQFQAKEFYLKLGYKIFGEISNPEFDLIQYFFVKRLD